MARLRRSTAQDFSWPTFPSNWVVTRGEPSLLESSTDEIEVRDTNEGVDIIDGGTTLAKLTPGEVVVNACDEWILCWLPRGKQHTCILMSRRSPIHFRVRTTTGFHDNRLLASAPRWDRDGRHFWLRYATHWEKRPTPDFRALSTQQLNRPKLPDKLSWKPLAGMCETTFTSKALPLERALAAWEKFSSAGLSSVICDAELLLAAADSRARRAEIEVAWQLKEASITPIHAVVARREFAQVADDRAISQRLDEHGAPEISASGLVSRRRELQGWHKKKPRITVPNGAQSPLVEQIDAACVVVSSLAPFQLPIAVGFGGFNNCPFPEEHAVFLAEWQGAYGAIPKLMSRDAVELHVPNPPKAKEATQLAWSQSIYCGETDRLEEVLAGCLASSWFFWWD